MGKFIDWLKKVISFAAVEPDTTKSKKEVSRVTNKVLLEELTEHFNEQMEELSVRKRVLYPMAFNILLHPDDYASAIESLPWVLPEVIAEFYASIKRKCSEFVDGVNYMPTASYWFFQFSACEVGTKNGEESFIKRGKIVTTGRLYTFDFKNAQYNNVHSESNVHLSVKCQNSRTNDNNINMKALLGMEILSEGTYCFNFDKNMDEDSSKIVAVSNTQLHGWAKLKWNERGETMVYEMLSSYIDISGRSDKREAKNILKIQSDAVNTSHVQIKYDQTTQMFSLAAYGKVRLNTSEVPISVGGDPQWVNLPKFNSQIFINDTVCVEFNANSDLV